MNYASSYTSRLKVNYTVFGRPHSSTFRYMPTAGIDAAKVAVQNFFEAVQPLIHTSFSVTSVEVASLGSDTFFPTTNFLSSLTGPSGSSQQDADISIWTFAGRSAGGTSSSKVFVRAFYLNIAPRPNNFKVSATASSDIAAAIAVLNSEHAAGNLCAIDGTAGIWHNRITGKNYDPITESLR
jgi:hypothetical protein